MSPYWAGRAQLPLFSPPRSQAYPPQAGECTLSWGAVNPWTRVFEGLPLRKLARCQVPL